jgi:PadR family transcriptional regulator, regulatory protein PadR
MSVNELTRKFSKELNSGTTALALLGILIRFKKPMYGYELGILLAGISDDGLPMNHGALYPVLRSLERLGLLTSEMEPSTTGPPRRYYKPTALGKSQFAEWTEVWNRTRNWLDGVLEQKDEQRDNKRTQHSTRRS